MSEDRSMSGQTLAPVSSQIVAQCHEHKPVTVPKIVRSDDGYTLEPGDLVVHVQVISNASLTTRICKHCRALYVESDTLAQFVESATRNAEHNLDLAQRPPFTRTP